LGSDICNAWTLCDGSELKKSNMALAQGYLPSSKKEMTVRSSTILNFDPENFDEADSKNIKKYTN
ncbi:hypothetical protein PV327_011323, partial [Microctonus hyperodae]